MEDSGSRVLSNDSNIYVMGNVDIPVIGVIKHSVTEVASKHIIVYILGNVHIIVMYAVRLSVTQVN